MYIALYLTHEVGTRLYRGLNMNKETINNILFFLLKATFKEQTAQEAEILINTIKLLKEEQEKKEEKKK